VSLLQNYPGAKTNSGIIPFIVNQIPYHWRYFELCAGSAQVFRHKRRAIVNYLNDLNPIVIAELFSVFGIEGEAIRYSTLPVLHLLPMFAFNRQDFIYLDPPYPASARRSGAVIYDCEMLGDDVHRQLLTAVLAMEANVMISTRPNDLYDTMLRDWRRLEFDTMGHYGPVTEVIFMNYPEPEYLHQYDMLGGDCWERQGVDRKRSRFADKLKRNTPYTNHLMIEELIKHDRAAVQHFLTVSAGNQSEK